jgi:Domain of unknown function (DUF4296)
MPSGIIGKDKMEILLWEQMKADAFTREFISKDPYKKLDEENIKLQQKIFAKYDVSEEAFYKSYDYYMKHTNLLKSILDSIVSKKTKEIDEAKIEKYKSIQSDNNRLLKIFLKGFEPIKKDRIVPIKIPFLPIPIVNAKMNSDSLK